MERAVASVAEQAPATLDLEWQRRVRDRAWRLAESGGAEGWLHNVLLLNRTSTDLLASTSSHGAQRHRRQTNTGGEEDDDEEKRLDDERRIREARRDLAKKQSLLLPLRLSTAESPTSDGATSSRRQRAGVVKAKIANLEAALRALDLEEEREEETASGDPADDTNLVFGVRPEAATVELDQALAYLRRQLHHTREALAREREQLTNTKVIEEALRHQLQQRAVEASSQEEREEMMSKVAELDDCNAALREGLLEFVERLYPHPFDASSGSDEPSAKKARAAAQEGTRRGKPSPPYASLRDTLVELLDVASAVQRPKKSKKDAAEKNGGGGWIPVASSQRVLWPPYVELLLRAGVIQKHPKDSSLLHLRNYTAQ